MYKLLGYDSEKVKAKFEEAQHQVNSLIQRIKAKKGSQDETVMSKFADQWTNQLDFEAKHAEQKYYDDGKPPVIAANLRPKAALQKKLNVHFDVRKTLKGHNDKIYAMQWAKDSKHLVSASQDGSLLIWDMDPSSRNQHKKVLGIPLRVAWVMTAAFSPNSKFVASGGLDNLCTIYNIADKGGWDDSSLPHRALQQHEGYVSSVRFVNDNQIMTASGDATCVLWDIEYQHPVQVFSGHNGDVSSVAINEQSRQTFISGSIDCTAKLWDMRLASKGRCIANFNGHVSDINFVKWFPDYQSFGTASDDGCCRLFDLGSYQTINVYGNKEEECFGVTCLDFSKSGYYMAASYDEGPECLAWNTVTAEQTHQMSHSCRVSCLEFAPNGSCLVTGAWDQKLRVWA